MSGMKMNVFKEKEIMDLLGKVCSASDAETLKKLREVSTPYNNALNKPFWDLQQVQLQVGMDTKNLKCIFPSGFERKLELKNWDSTIAPRIRELQVILGYSVKYLDTPPFLSSSENMDKYHVLFNQLFPYVTTLKVLNLPVKLNPTKLLNFIQQFNNLKNIVLEFCVQYREFLQPPSPENIDKYHVVSNDIFPYITTLKLLRLPKEFNPDQLLQFIQQFNKLKNISLGIQEGSYCSWDYERKRFTDAEDQRLNKFKSVLTTLKATGINVELIFYYFHMDQIEALMRLALEKEIKNTIHQLGFHSPWLLYESELERFAQFITEIENQSIISNILLPVYSLIEDNNGESIREKLSILSSFICDFRFRFGSRNFDLFNLICWPNLITLELFGYKQQLPDLFISCPKLQKFTIDGEESEVFFSNSELTPEQALQNIFGGFANSLKELKLRTWTSWTSEKAGERILRNNPLHKYLQELLPYTKIE